MQGLSRQFGLPVPDVSVTAKKIKLGNSRFVGPEDDLMEAYDWLKSFDRDGQMGVLSATNWRYLVLIGNNWALTSVLDLDTDYVGIIALAPDPATVVITRGTGGACVEQSADNVYLQGFTIKNTGDQDGDHAFLISAADNSGSHYLRMNFRHSNPYNDLGDRRSPVYSTGDMNGLWEFCKADAYSWRIAANYTLGATMLYCDAEGSHSYGGDESGTSISGTLRFCTGTFGAFGGCSSFGCDITGTLEYCSADDNSYALSREISGTIRHCAGGNNSFAKGGTLSGLVENCIAGGYDCFGMSGDISGQIINCRSGSAGEYAAGVVAAGSASADIIDNSAQATLTTSLGDNKDLKYTARNTGVWANSMTITYIAAGPPGITVLGATRSGITILRGASGARTANDVITKIQAYPKANSLVAVELAPGSDGTGIIDAMSATALSGGVDAPSLSGNHPWIPTKCIGDTTVEPFDNGHTYTNEGASGAVTFSLPAARAGMRYTFCRVDYAAGEDMSIDPNGTEHIYLEDGTDCGAGKYRGSDPNVDAYYEITVECFKDGEWRVVNEKGTGATEV